MESSITELLVPGLKLMLIGMGIVYLARDVDLDREVALKSITHTIANLPALRERLRRAPGLRRTGGQFVEQIRQRRMRAGGEDAEVGHGREGEEYSQGTRVLFKCQFTENRPDFSTLTHPGGSSGLLQAQGLN